MKILIIRNNIPNIKAEYTKEHLQKIENVDSRISVQLISPQKEIINKFLPEADILICTRHNFQELISL
ncbi:hypothetical protein A3B46_02810 [Candidatus Roizmanbacteria bacterium RIFCSPLOWO2_01_FULL_39_19]|nr:MAG: hypothetical protein A3B46_02810 [Candidatus Roizmanbacteria bacterium RIFCSPLOWO2_01_FULL_39_19]